MHIHIGHNFFGAGNFGDDLVLAGFLAGIGRPPGLKLTGMTNYDIESQRRRFPQIEWAPSTSATREALIVECDVWLGLGGAVLQPHNDSWLLADQVIQLEECRRRGKPVFFLGCGVDYRQDAARREIRLLLDSARWIWPREALSSTALRQMGFTRETAGADMSHLALRAMALPGRPIEADSTGFVCNFELSNQYTMEHLAGLITATAEAGQMVGWLVQEVRPLPGSEHDLRDRLPADVRPLLQLREPDYATADMAGLVRSWGVPARIFTTRFHGAIVGGWLGSRVVAFERQQKLRGIAQAFGVTSFTTLPDAVQLAQAFERSQPVDRSILDRTPTWPSSLYRLHDGGSRIHRHTDRRAGPGFWREQADDHHASARRAPFRRRHRRGGARPDWIGAEARRDLRRAQLPAGGRRTRYAARDDPRRAGRSRRADGARQGRVAGVDPAARSRADRSVDADESADEATRQAAGGEIVDDLNKLLGLGANVHFEDTPNV